MFRKKRIKKNISIRHHAAQSQDKILPLNQLAEVVNNLKKQGKVVVHCHGVFDLMHPGHIFHFESAKKQGDILVVTVTEDKHVNKGPGRPVFPQDIRARTIASLAVVDYVAINPLPSAANVLLAVKPNLYVKGDDYADESKDITGEIAKERQAIESIGGKIFFTKEPTFSSSKLLNDHFNFIPPELKEFINKFRKKYSSDEITKEIKKLNKLKVLVIGETIVDEYHYCFPMGKSAKESIVASKYLREESFAGGVLACANHAAGFVKKVCLVSCLGAVDSKEDFIKKHLKEKIFPRFVYHNSAPTIVKRRYIWEPFLIKLFEIVFMDENKLPKKTEWQMLTILDKELPKYDLVILTDYGHGLITPAIIKKVTNKAKFLAINAQTNSANIGFNLITKYSRADYVCIDDPEMRLAYHNRFGDIRQLVKKAAGDLKAKYVTVTRGHLGSLVYSKKHGFAETPILSREIVDRMGAGDAFLAITALCVAAKFPPNLVGFIGNAVGVLAVRTVGNRSSVEPVALVKFITSLLK